MDNIYPIGKFEYATSYSDADTQRHIQELELFPKQLKTIAAELRNDQLNKSYRPGGWNARQIVHHIADSHLNAYMRIKLTVTEDRPIIKPYDQDLWANLDDSLKLPLDYSLQLIEMVHYRMVYVLKSLDKSMFQRTYIHPEHNREFRLDQLLAQYAWHGKHHAGHLTVIINS
jgi:uncharacterized damage-inducible protein DinB